MNTTKTAQFTPGPYELRGSRLLTDSNGVVLADNIGANWPGTIEGQANLFAAAPAMYEALQHAAMSYHHPACSCKGEYASQPERYCTCHVQKARQALAQAEGK